MILQPVDDASPTNVAQRTIISHDVPLVIFAQPTHPLVRSPRLTAVGRDTLGDYPLYISDAAGDFHLLVRRYLQDDGLPGPHIHPTGSVESVKRSVLSDARAIGLLPAYALAEDVRDHRIVALRVQPGPPPMRLEALTPSTRSQHPAVHQLIDGVAAAFAPPQRAAAR
jgi:DNA-binding transcriptional LysR family regulator